MLTVAMAWSFSGGIVTFYFSSFFVNGIMFSFCGPCDAILCIFK